MSLVTFDRSGFLPTNTYLTLTVVGGVDVLVLAEFVDNPYSQVREGFDSSDNRSLTGSIRVKGNLYTPPHKWSLAFLVNRDQADLFEAMLLAQKNNQQLLLQDRFGVGMAGVPTTVWIDVDAQYLTEQTPDWLLLQFTAREEI